MHYYIFRLACLSWHRGRNRNNMMTVTLIYVGLLQFILPTTDYAQIPHLIRTEYKVMTFQRKRTRAPNCEKQKTPTTLFVRQRLLNLEQLKSRGKPDRRNQTMHSSHTVLQISSSTERVKHPFVYKSSPFCQNNGTYTTAYTTAKITLTIYLAKSR